MIPIILKGKERQRKGKGKATDGKQKKNNKTKKILAYQLYPQYILYAIAEVILNKTGE